eukprot:292256-Alexandrium_andersonii.AAC.1
MFGVFVDLRTKPDRPPEVQHDPTKVRAGRLDSNTVQFKYASIRLTNKNNLRRNVRVEKGNHS